VYFDYDTVYKCQYVDHANLSYKIFYTNRLTLIRKYNKIVQEPFKLKSIKEMS